MLLLILLLIYCRVISLIVYPKYQIFHVDDRIDYIISSWGIIKEKNSLNMISAEFSDIYYFKDFKHNLEEPLCIQLINYHTPGCLAFKNASINEYDITILNYENYYYCDNCNMNNPKKFEVKKEKYEGSPIIYLSYYPPDYIDRNNTFCLYPTSDISIFYISESKINQNFYKGKNISYILNYEFDLFNINNTFVINENEEYIFDLNAVSFKIINIENKKGRLFNHEEELFAGSFFNARSSFLKHKKIDEDGYLMTIKIATKPRNQKFVNISTCEEEANIFLYVARNNCTMNESSNNFCQNCITDYGKYEDKCYHKSEKLNNLYYDDSNNIWNKCEIDKNNFVCSICPKGTFRDPLSQKCVKCQKGEYNDIEDKIKCEKCPKGFYSDEYGASNCINCPNGYTSFEGSHKCYKECKPGFYPTGDICMPCKPGYYSSGSSTECLECIPGTYTNQEGMENCLKCKPGTFINEYKGVNCINCPVGFFASTSGSTECSECIPGTYANKEGMKECLKCEPGTYNNEYKQASCFDCPVGFFASTSGSTECFECPLGTFNSLVGNNQCEKCNIGYYNDELGSKECKICKPNYYSDNEGSSFCKECEVNNYSLFGFFNCLPCEETILHCIECSKKGICLKCDNNAISGFDNCTICENEMDWKFTGEFCQLLSICPKYFYKDKNNQNKIHCIEDINDCPESMKYLNLDTKECKEEASPQDFLNYQFKLKGNEELLNKVSDEIFETVEFDDFFKEAFKRRKIQLEGIDSKLQIGTENNIKKQNGFDIGIDFGNCPDIIRFNYGIQQNEELIYKICELEINGTKIIKKDFYDPNNLKRPLSLEPCEGQKFKIINPPKNNYNEILEQFPEVINIINDNIELFNAFSPIYTDPCYPIPILDKYDLILEDRRDFINEFKNKYAVKVCGEGCEYEGDNANLVQVVCFCPFIVNKTEKSSTNIFKSENKKYLFGNNFKVLKCYKTFNLEGQKNNFFSEIFLFLFILNICLIIITEINLNNNLNDLLIYCQEFINRKNTNNSEFNNLRNIYLKKEIKEKDKDIIKKLESSIKEKILNNPPKKRSIKNYNINIPLKTENNNVLSNDDAKVPSTTNEINKSKLKEKNKIKLDINILEKYHNYYIYLIYCYMKKERKKYLIEEELINLEYEYYRHIEDRNLFAIFISIFKLNYDFTNTFLIYNNSENYKEYKIYSIKVMMYIGSLIISIIFNLMFYSHKNMHKIYEDNGEYNFLYRLPIIVLSDGIMKIISFFAFNQLFNFQEKLIDLKNNLKNWKRRSIINKRKKVDKKYSREAFQIEISFRRKRKIFYVIIIIINIFSWYYISCFCSVYVNTQKHLLKDFLYSIVINIINCFIFSIIYFLIKIAIIKGEYSNNIRIITNKLNSEIAKILIEEIVAISVAGTYYLFQS